MSKTIRNEKIQTDLQTSDFYYDLPEERIAQHPVEPRDSSRLMVIDRESGELAHKHFSDVLDYLREGDVLVINDSKVIPARLYGHVEGRPDAAIEKFGFDLKWILGTGGAGQSTFDAIWYGSSISISLAFVCAAINMLLGVAIGAVWGFSRKFDIFMTEVYNVIANVPYILLISVIVLIMSASFWSMVFALTITGWISIAYFIRTQVIIIRDREYNLASRCLGTPLTRIATKNILPFMTSVIVTLAATEIPSYISYEVFLSYIGMGLSDMSLGKLIEGAKSAMVTPGWELEFWSPIAVASIIAVVLYVVGQNLGDASDPRTHM